MLSPLFTSKLSRRTTAHYFLSLLQYFLSLDLSSTNYTSPPIKEYESNAAAAFTYDQNSGGGNEVATTAATSATGGEAEEPMLVGSTEWYNSVYGDKSLTADMGTEDEGWNFDHYFRGPSIRNWATEMTILLTGAMPIIMGVLAATLME